MFARLSLVISLMVSFYAVLFSYEMSLMRSRTELGQFLRFFLLIFTWSHSEADYLLRSFHSELAKQLVFQDRARTYEILILNIYKCNKYDDCR